MPTDEPKLMIRHTFRAALKMVINAISVPFARREAASFTVAGQSVSGCFYYPHSKGKNPGVLLLPTATGLTPHEHAFAARLAREGYTTLVIAYTKRTTGRAVMSNDAQRRHLEQIVVAGWRVLQTNPSVDATNTAVIGLSLGGYFAVYLGTALKEAAPKAVAIYYGMYALAGTELMRGRVPLLILQGENDDDDFVANAKRVQEIAVRDEKPWDVVFYPGTGHQFDLFQPRGASARDAWERTVRFFSQQLGPSTLREADNDAQVQH